MYMMHLWFIIVQISEKMDADISLYTRSLELWNDINKWPMTLSVGVPSLSVSSVRELPVSSPLMTWKNTSMSSR